ncbi:MAG TPA: hypothetical protein VMW40_06525 [Candidatus Bathyarchaeia archaeon]|nr:hypothetical protein [Candidatus Bathyarchaeia archaeon]
MNVTLGMHISYKKYPVTPVFEYCEDPELTQQLIKDPTSVMKRKTTRRFFWLKLLIHGVFKGGQFVFDTIIPPCTKNQQNTVVARTLFQLDGDMLVIIDKNILARKDGIEIIEAHSSWSNWCLEQLSRAFSSAVTWLRYAQSPLFAIGLLLSLFGGGMYFKTRLPLSTIPIVVGIAGIIWSVIPWKLIWKFLVLCVLFRLRIQEKIKQLL